MGQKKPNPAPAPKGRKLRERETSLFYDWHRARFQALLDEHGITWDAAKAQLLACFERERALDALPADSAAKYLRRNGIASEPRLTDFELGRLSMLAEIATIEERDARALISKAVHKAVQSDQGRRGASEAALIVGKAIVKEAERLGYFALPAGSHDRRPMRLKIARSLNLNAPGGDDALDRRMRRALHPSKGAPTAAKGAAKPKPKA